MKECIENMATSLSLWFLKFGNINLENAEKWQNFAENGPENSEISDMK